MFFKRMTVKTRGHSKKLKVQFSRFNVRYHSFSRSIVPMGNKLPECYVSVPSLECFKLRLVEEAFLNLGLW